MRQNPRKRTPRRNVVITERDLRIIQTVRQLRFLTREMIQEIVGWSCTSKANARLRKLFDERYLERRFQPVMFGSPPAIYYLGPAGADIISKGGNIDMDSLTRHRYGDRNFSDSVMPHALGISQFGVQVAKQCRMNDDLEMLEWLNERDLQAEFDAADVPQKGRLKPDGFLRIGMGGKAFDFFVEYDTGSESRRRLKQKLESYVDLLLSGTFHRFSAVSEFCVLIITARKTRTESLCTFLPVPGHVPVRISDMFSTAESPLFGEVWLEPGSDTKLALHKPSLIRRRS